MKDVRKILGIISVVIFLVLHVQTASAMADSKSSYHQRVPILLYHHLTDNYDMAQSSVNISPKKFEEHMLALKKAGYNTITFKDYYNHVVYGNKLPENPLIITFDDGYSSNYEYAYPILKRLGMKATIFIVTSRVGEVEGVTYPHFDWDQAREMERSGVIDIQSHSDLHLDMTKLDRAKAQFELRRSRYLIEKELGKTFHVFAYPYGLFNAELQDMAQKAGYKVQVIVGDKGVNCREEGLTQLKRLTVFGNTSGEQLLKMIQDNMEYCKK
ncbi:MAG: polysaccharide deacetylase family protein [Clostridiaceae bacterium]|nr:polysaccharide deacetylase family protein [Clostridiaceae bacterium]